MFLSKPYHLTKNSILFPVPLFPKNFSAKNFFVEKLELFFFLFNIDLFVLLVAIILKIKYHGWEEAEEEVEQEEEEEEEKEKEARDFLNSKHSTSMAAATSQMPA